MHQVSRTVDSITLSWSQPDQPNGVILDYELQYYEKHTLGGGQSELLNAAPSFCSSLAIIITVSHRQTETAAGAAGDESKNSIEQGELESA
ncbi:Ephrin type-B receptor 2 [Liparis tanakae]|uniref:Ephrin type-B receptor 2 n=1 Tax=Liparis tanakae TaxID=230148 RepID=A0A4Z2E733_9TELE|nr:Ephrin type-B receptor 2 [Liparis tanakae]